ncbi:Pyrrolo-quinoline quinone repeat [Trinorchestia longiramus]|nr:Pyrrolo-quinoline quinone repeat [Trinorchestia longiramus]
MCCRVKYFAITCCVLIILCQANAKKDNDIREKLRTTGLLSDCFRLEKSGNLLLASTLDGDLHALSSDTGTVVWTHQDDPVVKNPKEASKSSLARFFPNPRDGSLYRYTLGTSDHPLKKLPFTIPQLVENSPCRSTDGLFYLGKKVDSFTVVNRANGDKQLVLGMQNIFEQCTRSPSIPRSEMLFIGRTMYNVMLYEQDTGNRWNVTFYDYTTTSHWEEEDYGFVHYAAAGGGTLVTLDKATESLVWTAHLDSPIVALFSITPDGNLMSVPMTVVASPTLQRYLREILRRGSYLLTAQSHKPLQQLNPSIYLGESVSGSTYAIPSLVDDQMATIKRRLNPRLLLDGPRGSVSSQADTEPLQDGEKKTSSPNSRSFSFEEKTKEYASSSANPFSSVVFSGPSSTAHAAADHSKEVPRDNDFPMASQSYRMEGGLFTHCMVDDALNPDVVVLGHYTVPEQLPHDMFPLPPHSLPLGITHLKTEDMEGTDYTSTGEHVQSHHDHIDVVGDGEVRTQKSHEKASSSDAIWSRKFADQDPKSPKEPVKRDGTSESTPLDVTQTPPLRYYSWVTESFIMGAGLFMVVGLIYCIYMIHNNLRRFNSGSLQATSGRSGGGSRGSQGLGAGGGEGEVTAQLEEQEDGCMKVGKITYEPDQQIGKGSEGTVVYRGAFEGRVAAVKRVLPNSYRIAAREVQLLRSSDHHPNVIRYLCTEQCREFRYIALELCDATLEHYVQHSLDALVPSPATDKLVVQQATRGVAHLHSLNIVHRDIKPSNVLLQLPKSVGCGDASTTEVGLRVLISDFGLCKQLEAGHGSFTKHSGITGTDGWIAPEMIRLDLDDQRPTRAVDIFSLGCLFYYVVTGGQHPYGHDIVRQGNIASGNNDLSGTSDACLTDLLRAMLSRSPKQRPPARAILRHPYFWDSALTLNFLVDVSDRIDKFPNDFAGSLLEQDSDSVAGQWVAKMHPEVYKDLRLHRDYKDSSVRDLLRAIRNKRTHYQELHPAVQAVMGSVPNEFLHYWTSRFPSLVHHAWRAMHCCRDEHAFAKYYSSKHVFHNISKVSLEPIVSTRPRPTVGIQQGLNSEYSINRLGTRSFQAYNQKRAKQQYIQQMRAADPYQSAFNKALDDGNWRTASPSVLPPPSEGAANAPWLLRKKKQPRIIHHPSEIAPSSLVADSATNSSNENCTVRAEANSCNVTLNSRHSRAEIGVSFSDEIGGAASKERKMKQIDSANDSGNSGNLNSSHQKEFHSSWVSTETVELYTDNDSSSSNRDSDDVEEHLNSSKLLEKEESLSQYQNIPENLEDFKTPISSISNSRCNGNESIPSLLNNDDLIAPSGQNLADNDAEDDENGSLNSTSSSSKWNVRAKLANTRSDVKLSKPADPRVNEPDVDSECTELLTQPRLIKKGESPDTVSDVKESDTRHTAVNVSNAESPVVGAQRGRKKKKKR